MPSNSNRYSNNRFIAWFFIIISLSGLTACTPTPDNQQFRLLAFGTYIDVELHDVTNQQAEQARHLLQSDFDAMHHAWHAWEPGPVGRINQLIQAGSPRFTASPSTLPLLKRSQQLAAQSDYLFDPGIGQLISLWGFHGKTHQRPPPTEAIQAWLAKRPSIRHISLSGLYLSSSHTQVKLDFGAIGKGYGISQAIKRLRTLGIKNAVVNAGGDLQAIGTQGERPWRIAIRDPQGAPDSVLGILSVNNNAAVFTSGDYERRFIWQNKAYHHIIDPRTGYPAEGTASVTVIHTDAAVADAAATALFIAGPTDWLRIARQMGIDTVLLVDTQGQLHMTPTMQALLELRQKRTVILQTSD